MKKSMYISIAIFAIIGIDCKRFNSVKPSMNSVLDSLNQIDYLVYNIEVDSSNSKFYQITLEDSSIFPYPELDKIRAQYYAYHLTKECEINRDLKINTIYSKFTYSNDLYLSSNDLKSIYTFNNENSTYERYLNHYLGAFNSLDMAVLDTLNKFLIDNFVNYSNSSVPGKIYNCATVCGFNNSDDSKILFFNELSLLWSICKIWDLNTANKLEYFFDLCEFEEYKNESFIKNQFTRK